jgi:hypothetical protein
VQGWLQDENPRSCYLLDTIFTHVGQGYAGDGGDRHYYVQMLGAAADANRPSSVEESTRERRGAQQYPWDNGREASPTQNGRTDRRVFVVPDESSTDNFFL